MSSTKRGFTLIELLVVIAIIAILAAILFPVFTQAKRRANFTRCMSGLKQVGLAMQMYRDDWRGRYPRYLVRPYYVQWPEAYNVYLEKYVKNRDVFICSTDPTRGVGDNVGWEGATNFPDKAGKKPTTSYLYWASYYFNGWPSSTHPPAGVTNWFQWLSSKYGGKLMIASCNWHLIENSKLNVRVDDIDSSNRYNRVLTLRADGSVLPSKWALEFGDGAWRFLEYGLYNR